MIWTTQPRSEGAGDIAYCRAGSGPAVVLIHGVGLRAEAWAGVLPLLEKRYSIYAVDMPGHGETPLSSTKTLPDFVDRIEQFIGSLNVPVTVAGHSMGAIIALLLAAQNPQSVKAIAALNAIFQRTPQAAQAVQARAAELATTGKANPAPTLDRWFGPHPLGALADARSACNGWLRTVPVEGYQTAYHAFAHQDGPSEDMLAALQMPSLFMTGAGDGNSTPLMSQAMSKLAPKGVTHIVDDAAHMMPMTHPLQVAEALIRTFERAHHG